MTTTTVDRIAEGDHRLSSAGVLRAELRKLTSLRSTRIAGASVGGAQILRDFPRFIRLAETGRIDLGSMVSRRITLDQINDGIDGLRRAEGVRTVIV